MAEHQAMLQSGFTACWSVMSTPASFGNSRKSTRKLIGGCIPFSLVMRLRRDKPFIRAFGPAYVFEAASYGKQGVGARFRPAASRLFESVAEDVLAGTFHDAGSDRQSMLPIEAALHSVRVGLACANAGRDGFGRRRGSRMAIT